MIVTKAQTELLTSPLEKGWKDIPTEIYHADKSAVNSGSLKELDKSPHAFARKFWGKPQEPTQAMKFGSLAHIAMLEGSKFKERYSVQPEFVGYTKDGKPTTSKNSSDVKRQLEEWNAAQPANAIIVTEEEREKLFNMIESVLSNEKAAKLLSNGKPEAIGYWKDEETGINCRMAADWISFDLGILADLKTTQDARWTYFRKNVENYDYHLQMMFYNEGIRRITGAEPGLRAWIAVESQEPYETRIHEVSPEYEEAGRMDYRRLMTKLKQALDSGEFKQENDIIEIGQPSLWFSRKYENLGILETL